MFAMKVFLLSLAAVSIAAGPTSENLNQSPSRTEKLPSSPKREKEVEPSIEIAPKPQKSHDEIDKPHRLSKRFIHSQFRRSSDYSNQLRSPFKRSGSTSTGEDWPIDMHHPPLFNDAFPGYRIKNSDYVTSYDPVLNYVLGFSKPKRFFGLLPAKEPRRKDLPPRLGEESAPRFARAFNPKPVDDPRPPPVSVTLSDVLKDYRTSWYQMDPRDFSGRRFLAQNFQIDTPININNVDVDLKPDAGLFGSDYSASDSSDYSETTVDDGSSEDDKKTTGGEQHHLLSRKEEFEKFKTLISLIVSQLKDLNRFQN